MISNSKFIEQIKKYYNREQLLNKLSKEIEKYLDEDWQNDGYEDFFSWYYDFCNGEAEENIVDQLIEEFVDHPSLIDIDEYCNYSRTIKDNYEFL